MLTPLTQFICDSCGQVIESPNDGWVEWVGSFEDNKSVDKNFRICHHKIQCQKLARHPHCSDLPLRDVIGNNVHAFIFTHLDVGPYHDKESRGPSIVDFRQYTDFMRRLTLPYYEEARQWWNEAMKDGYFGDANEIYIYLPDNLQRMIQHYSSEA